MEQQTVLVTGSSSGLGNVLTRTLLAKDYTVFATMRDLDGKNSQAAAELRKIAAREKGNLHLLEMDVVNEDSVQAAVEQALKVAGRIDVVINNAGIGGGGYSEAFSVSQFQLTFDVNVFGVQRVMRAVLPSMRLRRSGLIINISSAMGRIVIPFAGAYTASKYALEGLTESYRYELANTGVEVVLVEPGGFMSDYWTKLMTPDDAARTASYGESAQLPEQMWNGVIGMLNSEQAPDSQVFAEAIVGIIDTSAEKRPLRVVVDPLTGGGGPSAINTVTDGVQKQVLESFGLGSLLG
ncbi:MAG: SDR family oxidoreductase [Chloroflexi bacterium]|nr:SDR family oxidoreductase [Chloroflexota bacterium]